MSSAVSRKVLALVLALPAVAAAQPDPAAPPDPSSVPQPSPEPVPAPLPEPVPPPEPAPIPVSPAEAPPLAESIVEAEKPQAGIAYDKGFKLSSGDDEFELKLALRTQTRFEVTKPDASSGYLAAFSLPRIRLQTEGFAYGKANRFKLEFDFASRGNPSLKDFWVNRDLGGVHLRGGQWKRPFTRHQMTADFGLQFLEGSIQGQFATDRTVRDIGVAVHNDYEKSPEGIEYVVGFFNGTGEGSKQKLTCTDAADPTTCTPSTPTNVPADYRPMVTARVGWNHGGIKGYSEGDLEGGPLRFAVGAGYKLDFNTFARNADDELQLGHAFTVDGVVKVEGFSLTGALALVKANPDADSSIGLFGQAGYLVVPKKLELAGRFAVVPEPGVADETQQEILGAINYFFEGHNFKWMLDGGIINHTAGEGAQDLQIRTQVQLVL